MEPFEALVGTWTTEATHPLYEGGVVTGRVTFEWLEGGHFLIMRSHNDHEMFPDGHCIIGLPEDGDELLLEYFDSRGVRRTYRTSLEDGVWLWWRDEPGFDQRMTATLHPEQFVMQGELAREPGDWKDDLRATYTRVA
jgi:hypothetical protein